MMLKNIGSETYPLSIGKVQATAWLEDQEDGPLMILPCIPHSLHPLAQDPDRNMSLLFVRLVVRLEIN